MLKSAADAKQRCSGPSTVKSPLQRSQVTKALAAKEVNAAPEAFAVLKNFLQTSYHCILEQMYSFADDLESGKAEAILLQKYLCEDDYAY